MKPELSVIVQVKDGELDFAKDKFLKAVKALDDGAYTMSLTPKRSKHTDRARAYYHGVVVKLIAEHTGFTSDEQHAWLKAMHLDKGDAREGLNGRLLEGANNQWYVIGGTTRKLDVVQFYDYVERVRMWAADSLGIVTPDPDPNWREAA